MEQAPGAPALAGFFPARCTGQSHSLCRTGLWLSEASHGNNWQSGDHIQARGKRPGPLMRCSLPPSPAGTGGSELHLCPPGGVELGGPLGLAHSLGSENRGGQYLCSKFALGGQPSSADHGDSRVMTVGRLHLSSICLVSIKRRGNRGDAPLCCALGRALQGCAGLSGWEDLPKARKGDHLWSPERS